MVKSNNSHVLYKLTVISLLILSGCISDENSETAGAEATQVVESVSVSDAPESTETIKSAALEEVLVNTMPVLAPSDSANAPQNQTPDKSSASAAEENAAVDSQSVADSNREPPVTSVGMIPAVTEDDNKPSVSTPVIVISPSSATVKPVTKKKFTAAIAGLENQTVSWSYRGCGWIEKSSGIYHAPDNTQSGRDFCTVTITATSIQASNLSASSDVTVQFEPTTEPTTEPQSGSKLIITPLKSEIETGQTATLQAINNGQSVPVTWSREGCGWIEKDNGVYHAPEGISQGRETCKASITASSAGSPASSATALITVTLSNNQAEPVVSGELLLSPAAATLQTGFTRQFSANLTGLSDPGVTWRVEGCGWVGKATGLYHAPDEILTGEAQCIATVIVESTVDSDLRKSAQVTVNYIPPVVVVEPEIKTPAGVDPGAGTTGSLVVYPGVQPYKSERFSVSVRQNGSTQDSFVYKSKNTYTKSFDYTSGYMQEANHWTTFSFNGDVTVTAKRNDGKTIKSCVIRPQSLKIKPIISGDKCSFLLNKSVKVSVEIDETFTKSATNGHNAGLVTKYVVKHPLFVFADPLEVNVPAKNSNNVHYYGPGIHNVGEDFALKNGDHVYIAGGGFVKGTFKGARGAQIKFSGRGIISGVALGKDFSYSNHLLHVPGGNGASLSVEGLTFTDSPRAGIETNASAQINGVKMFSWYTGSDGVRTGKNSTIENSFFKVNDDSIKLYNSNITVRNSVIWQLTTGAAFQFGWQTPGDVSNVRVNNIDVIHSDAFTDYEGQEKKDNEPLHRSSKAIFSCMGLNNSVVSDVVFSNVRVEDKGLLRFMGMRLASHGPQNKWWGNTSPTAKKGINGMTFKNISLASAPYKESFLFGNKGGSIKNISFENLVVDGVKSRGAWDLTSKIDGAGYAAIENVSGVTIK